MYFDVRENLNKFDKINYISKIRSNRNSNFLTIPNQSKRHTKNFSYCSSKNYRYKKTIKTTLLLH